MTAVRAGVATDKGRARTINEDAYLVADPVFAIADGMGGHRAGEVASQVALEALRAAVQDATTDGLVEGVVSANVAVFDRASEEAELRGMGTTLCAVALVQEPGEDGEPEDRMAVVNVGDSRAYLFRDGELEQVTHDHTLVQTMVDDARITPEEAAVHPQRHIVTRALGIERDVQVDRWEITPFVGDRFLVCSDGLFNEVEDSRIASVLRRLSDPGDAAAELVRVANEEGGRDNITCVVVDVVDDDDRSGRASTALADEPTTTKTSATKAPAEPDVAGFDSPAPRPDDTIAVSAVPPPPKRSRRRARGPRPRRFTWRVALFLLLVLAVLGSAATAVWWYGRNTYYVGYDGAEVAVFRGRPGGFLWFDPTLVERTGIARDEVPAALTDRVQAGEDQPTLDDAQDFVANIQAQIDAQGPDVTIETTTTTATTSP